MDCANLKVMSSAKLQVALEQYNISSKAKQSKHEVYSTLPVTISDKNQAFIMKEKSTHDSTMTTLTHPMHIKPMTYAKSLHVTPTEPSASDTYIKAKPSLHTISEDTIKSKLHMT